MTQITNGPLLTQNTARPDDDTVQTTRSQATASAANANLQAALLQDSVGGTTPSSATATNVPPPSPPSTSLSSSLADGATSLAHHIADFGNLPNDSNLLVSMFLKLGGQFDTNNFDMDKMSHEVRTINKLMAIGQSANMFHVIMNLDKMKREADRLEDQADAVANAAASMYEGMSNPELGTGGQGDPEADEAVRAFRSQSGIQNSYDDEHSSGPNVTDQTALQIMNGGNNYDHEGGGGGTQSMETAEALADRAETLYEQAEEMRQKINLAIGAWGITEMESGQARSASSTHGVLNRAEARGASVSDDIIAGERADQQLEDTFSIGQNSFMANPAAAEAIFALLRNRQSTTQRPAWVSA